MMSKPVNKKSGTKSVSLQNSVHAYVSSCCSVLADKPSVKDSEGSLGKWRCSQCRKKCSVRPTAKAPFFTNKIEPVQGAEAL
jgi:hypothetical protein